MSYVVVIFVLNGLRGEKVVHVVDIGGKTFLLIFMTMYILVGTTVRFGVYIIV